MRRAALLSVLCLTAAALTLAPEGASDPPRLQLLGGSGTGRQFLVALAPPGTRVSITELTSSGVRAVDRLELVNPGAATWVRWRCDRRVRRFIATAELPDGPARARYATKTPSCRDRLALELRRPAGGELGRVGVAITDRWGFGARARLCVVPAGGSRRCREVRVPAGSRPVRFGLPRPTPGRWRVELRTRYQVERRTFVLGDGPRRPARRRLPLVLTVGDSMMEPLDVLLADALRGWARPRSSVLPGYGLLAGQFDWLRHAREEAARLRPDVTVIFLGTTDRFDARRPDGVLLRCCDAAWIEEYSRRAAEMGAAYARDGEGRVLWLTMPDPRPPGWREHLAAVNAALARAAAATPGAGIVAIDRLVSPGFRFRAFATFGGRRIRLRAEDGIHLSLAGSRLAARAVLRAIRSG
jgi:lysophospholipase L1-like esterase